MPSLQNLTSAQVDELLAKLDFNAVEPCGAIERDAPPPPSLLKTVEGIEAASTSGDLDAVRDALARLSKMADPERFIPMLRSSLHSAIEKEHVHVVAALLGKDVQIGQSHGSLAAKIGNTQILELLLKHGWDINREMGPTLPPPLALVLHDLSLTAWFLDHGADPNASCRLDLTPLSEALETASLPVIHSLFANGGSISSGQLLHYAVRRSLPDQQEVIQLVLDKGPLINNVMYQDHDCYNLQRALGLGTALHEAAEQGDVHVVRMLVDHGANPLVRDSLGRTARDRAEAKGNEAVARYLQITEGVATAPLVQFTDEHRANGFG